MRIILKPAGLLILLSLIAVLTAFAMNDISALVGVKKPAPAASASARELATARFRPIDLSRMGKTDWVHFGLASASRTAIADRIVRKAGAERRIGPLEFVGKPATAYEEDTRAFKWSDGDTFQNIPETRAGLTTAGVASGFRFTVTPTVGKRHIMRVWVGGSGVRSKLSARMSDGSPLSKETESLTGGGDGFRNLYTVVFEATKPDQRLIVSYLVAQDQQSGTVSIQAAALE